MTTETLMKYPEWMSDYPLEFWDDKKLQEYVDIAYEMFKLKQEHRKCPLTQ